MQTRRTLPQNVKDTLLEWKGRFRSIKNIFIHRSGAEFLPPFTRINLIAPFKGGWNGAPEKLHHIRIKLCMDVLPD